jgi:hypothetical protein
LLLWNKHFFRHYYFSSHQVVICFVLFLFIQIQIHNIFSLFWNLHFIDTHIWKFSLHSSFSLHLYNSLKTYLFVFCRKIKKYSSLSNNNNNNNNKNAGMGMNMGMSLKLFFLYLFLFFILFFFHIMFTKWFFLELHHREISIRRWNSDMKGIKMKLIFAIYFFFFLIVSYLLFFFLSGCQI